MKASEALAELVAAAKLNPDRVFSAPWEARAFAIAISLAEAGAFAWPEFRELLIEQIAHSDASQSGANVATADRYYEHFPVALERIVQEKGIGTEIVNPAIDSSGTRVLRS